MRIIVTFFILSLFISCGKNEKSASKNKSKPKVENRKKNPKKKAANTTDYWTSLQKQLKLTEDQVNKLKASDADREAKLKSASNKEARKVIAKNSKIQDDKFLGLKLARGKKNFDRDWDNPISLFHMRRKLSISRDQMKQIRVIKQATNKKIKAISETDKTKRQNLIMAFRNEEENNLIGLLDAEQSATYKNIRGKISNRQSKTAIAFQ